MSAISHFEITGPAADGRVRAAGLLDLLAAAVVAMIVIPQPIVRQALMSSNASPLGTALFVFSLLAAIFLALWLYLGVAVLVWGRSPGMYLLDVGVDAPQRPTPGQSFRWALGWVLAAIPAVLGVAASYAGDTGLPARLSGLTTASTAPAESTL